MLTERSFIPTSSAFIQAAHPALKASKDLQLFLEASETDFAIEVSRTADETGAGSLGGSPSRAARKTLSGAAGLLRSIGQQAAGLVSGKRRDEGSAEPEEDAEYLRHRSYIEELENQLAEVHRQAAKLVKQRAEVGAAVEEFGAAMAALGRHERGEGVGDTFSDLGDRACGVADLSRRSADDLAKSFEAPLKELVRAVKAAKKVAVDRSAALAEWRQAKLDAEARRARLAKLRGTPGIKEERVAEAERELAAAQQRALDCRSVYEGLARCMREDLPRFQVERAEELGYVLRDFAAAEAKTAAEQAQLWRSLVPSLAQVGEE
jgi:sorting nexin-1/2